MGVAGTVLKINQEICKRGNAKTKKVQYPNIQMVFKDFDAKFLKRAESEVFFCCKNGPEIVWIMEEAQETGERCEIKTQVVAVTRKNNEEEKIADFNLTISLKKKVK